jgi:hypothetical protein
MSLTAAVEVPPGQTDARALRVTLRITNPAGPRVAILNPDMGVPSRAVSWPFSNEVYRTALLISFGYLSMSVTDEAGNEVPREPIMTSATPALRPPLELGPGDSFEVTIPIGTFYQLESRRAYQVALEYGDQKLKVSARTRVIAP